MDFLATIQANAQPVLEQIFLWITIITDFKYLLVVMLILYWCVNKNWAYRIGFSVMTASFINGVAKLFFQVQRPWARAHDPAIKRIFPAWDAATGYSFPSGHAMGFTAFFLPMLRMGKTLVPKILACIAVVLMVASRVYLRVHTPLDVIAGVTAGLLVFLIMDNLYLHIEKTKKYHWMLWGFIPVTVGLLLAHYLSIVQTDASAAEGMKDTVKAAGGISGFCISYFLERRYIGFCEKATLAGQLVKCAVGAVGAVFIMQGLKMLLPDANVFHFIRYMLVALWAMAAMPYLIKNYMNRIIKPKKQEQYI